MSIASNFPAIKPTLLLDFANTEELNPRITFTRASTATYYGTQTAKAEENLLLQSQTLTTAPWAAAGAAATSNTDTAPDGTATADAVKEDSATSTHRIQTGFSCSAGAITMSAFVKQKTGLRFATIGFSADGSNWVSATFDLSTGSNTQTLNAGFTSISATSAASVNSWYRVSVTATSSVTITSGLGFLGLSATSTPVNASRGFDSYAGDNTSEILYWGAQLEQRSAVTAYTPTTTQPITNYIPQLLTAASGVARFDHNPTTFESLGLLIEEQRTNLLLYSEQFDNAAWTNVRSSITSNALIAPDGTLTSDKLVIDTTAAANHSVGQATTITSGTTYTWVVYAKAGEFTEINLRFSAQFPAGSTFFNLLTGVTTNAGGVSTSSATPVGNGWYRCSITQTANTSGAAQPQVFLAQGNSITIATGNGVSGIYIWGAQLEAGAFATSYIPTVASQVTRAADAASMTGTNFSSWYNATEGTLFAEGESVNAFTGTVGRRYAEINDGTGSNVVNVEFRNTTQSRFNVSASAVSQAAITSGGTINQFSKLAGAYAANNFAFSANGTLGTPDTSGTVPVVSQLNIGSRADNVASATINGHIKKIAYYPRRLSNAELQGITA